MTKWSLDIRGGLLILEVRGLWVYRWSQEQVSLYMTHWVAILSCSETMGKLDTGREVCFSVLLIPLPNGSSQTWPLFRDFTVLLKR